MNPGAFIPHQDERREHVPACWDGSRHSQIQSQFESEQPMIPVGFFAPGPFELIIVAVIIVIPLVIVVVVLLANRKSPTSTRLQDDLIRCPECGEWIQRRAVMCRFCDARFDGQ